VLNKKACYLNGNNRKSGRWSSNTPHNVKPNGGKKAHKLLMFGDNFLKGSAEIVRTLLSEKCNVFSVVKPGSDLRELPQSLKNEVLTLTFMDTLVLCGGSNDLDKYKSIRALKLVTEFVKSNDHTNIFLLSVPYCHDIIGNYLK
jgi:hypothetical protein